MGDDELQTDDIDGTVKGLMVWAATHWHAACDCYEAPCELVDTAHSVGVLVEALEVERAARVAAEGALAAKVAELEALRGQMAWDFAAVIESWAAQLEAGNKYVAAEMRQTARVNRLYYGNAEPAPHTSALLLDSPDAGAKGEVR